MPGWGEMSSPPAGDTEACGLPLPFSSAHHSRGSNAKGHPCPHCTPMGWKRQHPGPELLPGACTDERVWGGGCIWPWAVGTALILPALPAPQICSLMRGGIAERGGIRVGHRIIEINGQSVVATPHEKIIQILTQAVSEVSRARAG